VLSGPPALSASLCTEEVLFPKELKVTASSDIMVSGSCFLNNFPGLASEGVAGDPCTDKKGMLHESGD
jgi:hypothetical protein